MTGSNMIVCLTVRGVGTEGGGDVVFAKVPCGGLASKYLQEGQNREGDTLQANDKLVVQVRGKRQRKDGISGPVETLDKQDRIQKRRGEMGQRGLTM